MDSRIAPLESVLTVGGVIFRPKLRQYIQITEVFTFEIMKSTEKPQ